MAGIGTIAELRAQFERYFKRPDLVDFTDEFLRKGERRITRMLRLPIQEAVEIFDLGTVGNPIPVPTDFLETKILMNGEGTPITIELNHIYFARDLAYASDFPTKASRVGSSMYLWPVTSGTVTWIYYKELESLLTVPEIENLLLKKCNEAWLHAMLMEGGILTRNVAFEAEHEKHMMRHLELLAEMAHRDQFAGTSITAQSEYAVD